ncbi:MAG TPA: FAD-dependent oxidoreductase, partial [Chitinophagales bacterium]
MSKKTAIVVGAGIVGMATARALAEKGFSVTVFERNEKAVGASIRNFGMVWPTGQPLGTLRNRALRSREIWKEAADNSGIWNNPCGSLLNVYHDDELAVIGEFYAMNKDVHDCKILSAEETIAKSPATNPKGLKASLWSATELIVDPREAIFKLPAYLTKKYGIEFHFNKAVPHVETGKVYSGKNTCEADLIFVCSGEDFETLYPETYTASGITKCKLQM